MKVKLFKSWMSFALISIAVLQSRAADIVWTNAGSGNWSGTLNWSPNQVPGASDNAFITNNGSYTVTISADASANTVTVGGSSGTQTVAQSSGTFTIAGASAIGSRGSLSFSGGTLAGSGDVTITGTLNWSAGIMAGAGRTILSNGATASFSSTSAKGLNRALDNSGTVTYSGNALYFGYGAAVAGVINNLAGGVFNASGEADFSQSSAAAHAFNNSGTFNKSGAGTTTDFSGVAFNNSDTANVTAGTLNVLSSGSNSGVIDLLAGTTLTFAGNFTTLAGSVISGAGNVNFSSGTHNLVGEILTTGTVTISGATVNFSAPHSLARLTFSNGTLQGNGNVTITNTFNWSGGAMNGAGHTIVAGGATGNFTSTSAKGLNRTLDNSGTITYSGNALYFGYGAAVAGVINNLAGGVFNASGEATSRKVPPPLMPSTTAAHSIRAARELRRTLAGWLSITRMC